MHEQQLEHLGLGRRQAHRLGVGDAQRGGDSAGALVLAEQEVEPHGTREHDDCAVRERVRLPWPHARAVDLAAVGALQIDCPPYAGFVFQPQVGPAHRFDVDLDLVVGTAADPHERAGEFHTLGREPGTDEPCHARRW